MKRVMRYAALLFVTALASCSRGTQTQSVLPALQRQNADVTAAYSRIYSFPGKPSGAEPTGLTLLGGAMYGTTMAAGANTFGGVFERNASGKVTQIYSFKGGADGSQPQGTLVVLNGTLYGTTEFGGKYGNGTIYSVTPTGSERVIYAFKGGNDGATPVLLGMVAIGNTLYGTTSAGGNAKCSVENSVGCGVVFAVGASGKERVLHRFAGGADGALPSGTLTVIKGRIYGTTNFGGRANSGTVYDISTSGAERVLYAFKGYPDGAVPYGGVTPLSGSLYGTTAFGGPYSNAGTVFELTSSGVEHALHNFSGYPDGAVPYAALSVSGSLLYGTTAFGGNSGRNCTGGAIGGCGIVFSVDTGGSERILYRFRGIPDGSNPWSSLLLSGGTFYGTTILGGSKDFGTIFTIGASPR